MNAVQDVNKYEVPKFNSIKGKQVLSPDLMRLFNLFKFNPFSRYDCRASTKVKKQNEV